MRRLFLIARREYFAYTRTVGFWLSMLVLPGFIVLGAMLPAYMKNAAPTRQVAIVDLTGQNAAPALKAAMARNLLRDQANKTVTYDEELVDRGVIDSMGLMNLIAFLEERVGVRVPDDEVMLENFATINAIVKTVDRLKERR